MEPGQRLALPGTASSRPGSRPASIHGAPELLKSEAEVDTNPSAGFTWPEVEDSSSDEEAHYDFEKSKKKMKKKSASASKIELKEPPTLDFVVIRRQSDLAAQFNVVSDMLSVYHPTNIFTRIMPKPTDPEL